MEAKRYSLIDSHVHIDELPDLEGTIRRAQSVGIKAIIAVGFDLISSFAMDSEIERCVGFGEVGLDFKAGIEKALSLVAAGLEKAVFHWWPVHVLTRIIEKGYSISATPGIERPSSKCPSVE